MSFSGTENLLQEIKNNLICNTSSILVPAIWTPQSTFDNNPSLYPDLCECCFATKSENNAFWQIDLGHQYFIYSVEVLSRSDIDFRISETLNGTRTETGWYFIILFQKLVKARAYKQNQKQVNTNRECRKTNNKCFYQLKHLYRHFFLRVCFLQHFFYK